MTTHTFELATLDGETMSLLGLEAEMRTWLSEQQIDAVVDTKEYFTLLATGFRHSLRVAIEDTNHALWFKMRWSNDLALFVENERKRSEEIRALLSVTATNKIMTSIRPHSNATHMFDYCTLMPRDEPYKRPTNFKIFKGRSPDDKDVTVRLSNRTIQKITSMVKDL